MQLCNKPHLRGHVSDDAAWLANQLIAQQLLYNQQWANGVRLKGECHVLSLHTVKCQPFGAVYSRIVDD